MASNAAGNTPMVVRTRLIPSMPAISSCGLSGLTDRWPRLRDHISSMNDSATPRLPRNITSHRMTAPIRMPPVSATHDEWVTKNWLVKPHRVMLIAGQ